MKSNNKTVRFITTLGTIFGLGILLTGCSTSNQGTKTQNTTVSTTEELSDTSEQIEKSESIEDIAKSYQSLNNGVDFQEAKANIEAEAHTISGYGEFLYSSKDTITEGLRKEDFTAEQFPKVLTLLTYKTDRDIFKEIANDVPNEIAKQTAMLKDEQAWGNLQTIVTIDITKSLPDEVSSFMNDANISNSELLTLDGYDDYPLMAHYAYLKDLHSDKFQWVLLYDNYLTDMQQTYDASFSLFHGYPKFISQEYIHAFQNDGKNTM